MARQYPFSAYDQYLSLKMSATMWVATLFLARPFAILLASVANRRDRTGLMNTFYHDPVSLAIDTFAALPAVLVVVAYMRRRPGAPQVFQDIWTHGRELLLLATLLNLISIFLPFFWNTQLRMGTPEFAKLAVTVVILFLLIRSNRVRDTFNDFPQPVEEQKKRARGN
jgi:hypothetical protein